MFSLSVLNQVINDTAPASATLKRVGIVGSYATDAYTKDSDIDLVFDTDSKLIDEAVMSAGLQIKTILNNQFNKNVDIINYNTILQKCEQHADAHYLEVLGYENMLKTLKWVWRKAV